MDGGCDGGTLGCVLPPVATLGWLETWGGGAAGGAGSGGAATIEGGPWGGGPDGKGATSCGCFSSTTLECVIGLDGAAPTGPPEPTGPVFCKSHGWDATDGGAPIGITISGAAADAAGSLTAGAWLSAGGGDTIGMDSTAGTDSARASTSNSSTFCAGMLPLFFSPFSPLAALLPAFPPSLPLSLPPPLRPFLEEISCTVVLSSWSSLLPLPLPFSCTLPSLLFPLSLLCSSANSWRKLQSLRSHLSPSKNLRQYFVVPKLARSVWPSTAKPSTAWIATWASSGFSNVKYAL